MRIGLFTDTYHPSTNGIVAVVDITRRELEAAGHEVYVFCPSGKSEHFDRDDPAIIRFPSVPTGIFDDHRLSAFIPRVVLQKIKKLDLDVLHFFTPFQVGIMAVYAAERTNAVLVGQHSTDLYQYVDHYPQVLPGLLLFATTLPFTVKFKGEDVKTLLSLYKPRKGTTVWNRDIVERSIALLYSRCDTVIALSRKSQKQLYEWQNDQYTYDVELMPTGVNALPRATKAQMKEFNDTWGIKEDDVLIGYVGRLGAEKNLDLIIDALPKIVEGQPNAKLLLVGDFDYRETLEELVIEKNLHDKVIFAGRMPRDELARVYQQLKAFLFPSVTDTQGLVLHEAALAGCPLVIVDEFVTEILEEGVNGFVAENKPEDFANKVLAILSDPDKQTSFSKESKRLARKFSEKKQVAKQISLYKRLIKRRDEAWAKLQAEDESEEE